MCGWGCAIFFLLFFHLNPLGLDWHLVAGLSVAALCIVSVAVTCVGAGEQVTWWIQERFKRDAETPAAEPPDESAPRAAKAARAARK